MTERGVPSVEFRRKVAIYATLNDRLLVFLEPDFPESGLQVPGGTVEEGESFRDAALREFAEETGIELTADPKLLGVVRQPHEHQGQAYDDERAFFHAVLSGPLPETWEWVEQTPHDGGAPVRLSYFWLTMAPIPSGLGRLAAMLPELLARLEIAK